jgi:hypothetical protein
MALILANHPDPQDPTTPIPEAYAWIEHIQLGMSDGSGRLVVWVHRSPAAAQVLSPPAETVEFHPGDGTLPSIPQILADPVAGPAFLALTGYLYGRIAVAFPGAVQG